MSDKAFYKQPTLREKTPPSTSASPVPSKIGPYQIDSVLSKGGTSLLYLGLHPETKQPLAIKVLLPAYVTHPEMIERFLQEAEIIALTNHPNIVKLYGQGTWEGGLYIAMEFIQGISLSQFIMQHSLSLKRSLDIVLQVAYALCHLHTHRVIHRDLKPENILITEDGEVKVIDFGIAALHEEGNTSQSKSFMGTPSYMAPEQKEDSSKASYSSDIYALGIITYELVVGKLSYGVLNLSLVPKGLRTILEKALAVSPEERYQDIVDFITDISQYLRSGEWEKDRPGSDQLKEWQECLQKAQTALSPSLPDWPDLEIGLTKSKQLGSLGLYYDFFKASKDRYIILMVETHSSHIDAPVYIGVVRGMVRTLIANTPAFSIVPFVTTLNEMLAQDTLKETFGLSILVLDPDNDQLSFISCGDGSLLQLPRNVKLTSQNKTLGLDPQAVFSETIDNWNVGDRLLLVPQDIIYSELLLETALLSPQRQTESLSKALQKKPKALLAIERL